MPALEDWVTASWHSDRGADESVCSTHLVLHGSNKKGRTRLNYVQLKDKGQWTQLKKLKRHLIIILNPPFHCKGDQTLDQMTSSHPWSYSKPEETQPWSTCSSWPTLVMGIELVVSRGTFHPPWFYEQPNCFFFWLIDWTVIFQLLECIPNYESRT